jgi:hypothetical protein
MLIAEFAEERLFGAAFAFAGRIFAGFSPPPPQALKGKSF